MRPRFNAVLRLEFLSSKHEKVDLWKKPTLKPGAIFSTSPHLQQRQQQFLIENFGKFKNKIYFFN